ncbi:winged helix-turn-helix transcriptional regulator [Streptacidiphilus sp. MAP5-52]|uniref:winged helix-turn-helix transcriptional regulator n=1 Tax=Streptacidiphilus sp. MAP5-52 TaxID=3156267 RepID=UPI00351392EF
MTTATLATPPTIHRPSRVQQAAEQIAPRWHVWILQSLGRDQGMTWTGLHGALPMIDQGTLTRRLQTLADHGLVNRSAGDDHTVYTLTGKARALEPVLEHAETWTRTHRPGAGPLSRAQAAEEALAPLSFSYATSVLARLRQGSASRPDLFQVLPVGSVSGRLATLEEYGLITRTGTRRQYQYHLTDAGRALGPLLDALDDWAHGRPTASGQTAASPALAAGRAAGATAVAASAAPETVPVVDQSRAARPSRAEVAQLRQATTRLVFSHKPAPQPAPLIPSTTPAARRR